MRPGTVVVSATKGLERVTWTRMSQVLGEELPAGCPIVVLSGPSFAHEVARELPTAMVAAATDAAASARVLKELRGKRFRLYATDDVVGVEIGGAYKNVIAIAAGVVEGLGLGHNALAGLVTRGLAEMTRLAVAMGGRHETLAGLSGLGDLVLTCTGAASRNHHLGVELGEGRAPRGHPRRHAHGGRGRQHRRGHPRARGSRRVELPIAEQMADVLAGRTHPHGRHRGPHAAPPEARAALGLGIADLGLRRRLRSAPSALRAAAWQLTTAETDCRIPSLLHFPW